MYRPWFRAFHLAIVYGSPTVDQDTLAWPFPFAQSCFIRAWERPLSVLCDLLVGRLELVDMCVTDTRHCGGSAGFFPLGPCGLWVPRFFPCCPLPLFIPNSAPGGGGACSARSSLDASYCIEPYSQSVLCGLVIELVRVWVRVSIYTRDRPD